MGQMIVNRLYILYDIVQQSHHETWFPHLLQYPKCFSWVTSIYLVLKGHWQGGTNPPFLFAKSKVLLCTNQTKKTASKNIDFWRSYGHLKLPFFDGQKKRSIRANLICDVIAGTFFRNYQFLCFDQCE